jgi:hypothetical protein
MHLVIHAGFGKCGSSSIQHALRGKEAELRKRSIFLFGENLTLNLQAARPEAPFWKVIEVLRDPRAHGEIATRTLRELERASSMAPDGTAILSAELLGLGGFERLFAAIDTKVDTTLVFYIRPQFEWIPSAWKQWHLKTGAPLKEFVEQCQAAATPRFRRSLDKWAAALPKARIVVRILAQAIAESGSPGADFFRILGLDVDPVDIEDPHSNPSLDFAILHVLNKNPWLFRSQSDNKPFKSLVEILPAEYLRTNVKMLSLEDEEKIAARFRDDNIHILRTYVGLSEAAANETYARYFQPKASGRTYADFDDVEILERCLGILLEAMIREHESRRPVLRPPYWKAPLRLARRVTRRV